jgi:uncharacterized protein (TIGR03437 family)
MPYGIPDSARPARSGEVVVLYATGMGQVTPSVREGSPAPSDPLASVVAPIKVTIQSRPAEVVFAGLAPGMAGVYQLNIVVPEGLDADPGAPLVVRVGEESESPPVTLAVLGAQTAPPDGEGATAAALR